MKTFEGKLVSKEIKIGIVAARFNEFITAKLLEGAMDGLLRHNMDEKDIHVAWVPGAFEIPLIASVWEQSFVVQPAIMIMYAAKFQKGLLLFLWRVACQ